MKVIDAHTHVFPEYIDLAVQVMDRCGYRVGHMVRKGRLAHLLLQLLV